MEVDEYRFINEDGEQLIRYDEYLEMPELREQVNDPDRERLFLGKTVLTFDPSYLKQNESKRIALNDLRYEKVLNPIQYFCPSGPQALGFLNCGKKMKFMVAPNRFGKSVTAIIDWILDIIPCDKDWPIFTEHGVEWRPFRPPEGGYKIGASTYKWANHKRTIFPEFRKWLPQSELGPYGVDWKKKGAKVVSWERNPLLPLQCGSEIYFFVYEMDQDQFEGQALDGWLWDEQGEEAKWIGANERTRTRKGRHVFSLTPHKVKGRPDTGAGSWIHRIVKKERLMGYLPDQIEQFKGSLEEVPDWVYPEEEKESAYRQHILEPTERNDREALREGRSRFYGDWHLTSGLVYSMWEREIHLVDPFEIPSNWALYRSMDHGKVNPCACLWVAVPPDNKYIVLYREYYKPGLISDHCREIIRLSGNRRARRGTYRNNKIGMVYDKWVEEHTEEKYVKTALDGRTFSRPDDNSGLTIAELYGINGLKVAKSSGKTIRDTVPLVEEWMTIDWEKEHPFNTDLEGNKIMGRPRIYAFSNLKNFITEIENYVIEETTVKKGQNTNVSESPRRKDDHLMDALRYLIQLPPRWKGHVSEEGRTFYKKRAKEIVKGRRDSITGY